MSKVRTVAWRDFRYTVMTKAFLFAIVGIPVLIIGVMVVTVALIATHEEPPLVGTVAVVDAKGEVADAIDARFAREEGASGGVADAIQPDMPDATDLLSGQMDIGR